MTEESNRPKIMTGQACIRGMRVPVSLVLNLTANGQTPEAILEDYPYLEPEDIQQSLQYAALTHPYPSEEGKASRFCGDLGKLLLSETISNTALS
jgi:uncharacterized protein (DUF433 family)